MNVSVTFTSVPPPPPPSNIRTLRKWSELTHPLDIARYNANGVDQFGYYQVLILGRDKSEPEGTLRWCGDWSNNNLRSKLDANDMAKVAAMQTPDESTVYAKMDWFCYGQRGTTGAPMISTNWMLGAEMIVNFYPGQKVEVLETKTMLIDWQGVKGYEPMARLRTFSRADFGKTWASHPHLVHKCTAVSVTNSYREKVKGTVYSPVALGPDFDFAGNFIPAQWWVMERLLL